MFNTEKLRAFAEIEDVTCLVSDHLGRLNALAPRIHPLVANCRVAGPVVTVKTLGNDLTAVFAAIDIAHPGDVIVIDTQGSHNTAFWGENTTLAALQRDLAGVVIDGPCRDISALRRLGFPVFGTGACPNAGVASGRGRVNQIIQCGGVPVSPGDIVVGDDNGVVIIPQAQLAMVLVALPDLVAAEQRTRQQLENGARLTELKRAVLTDPES